MTLPLARVVSTSAAVAATRARTQKVALLGETLAAADPDEIELVAAYLAGHLPQRRTGIGWRSMSELPTAAKSPSLTVAEVDAAFEDAAQLSGAGSGTRRLTIVRSLLERATVEEQRWLAAVATDNLRQGASDAVLLEAVAVATAIPIGELRSAAMLLGSVVSLAGLAARAGRDGVQAVELEVGRPVQPMLAASAPDAEAAWSKLAMDRVAVDRKLDGIRIQAHKQGNTVLLVTRSLDDVTDRLPRIADQVRALPVTDAVLDGEALAVGEDGKARPFQETAAQSATHLVEGASTGSVSLSVFFFDLLHDGESLLASSAHERYARLEQIVPAELLVPRVIAESPEEVRRAFDAQVEAGHEGIVVKDLGAPYAAGRRGSAWVKVKPVLTLDLVVLAVERGNGRRTGWLSNLHLGARDPATGEFVMVGKTFKGMTDAVLAWQTERFRELEVADDGYTVSVRPEQVVEIAIDGVQRSTRYPGGVALRFARVVNYRDDKPTTEVDTITTLQGLLGSSTQ